MSVYVKKKKKVFKDIYKNIDIFILYMKDNFNYLNFENDVILFRVNDIYIKFYNDNLVVNGKLNSVIYGEFGFKFKNRYQINFWKERGHYNSNEIVGNIQKINSDKVKNRFVPNSENLSKFGYDKDIVKSWRAGPNIAKYWINRGYSEDDAIIKVSEHQKKLAKNIDYGKRVSDTTKEYYLNRGYSEDESLKLLADRQHTIQIDKYILKYGVVEGVELYNIQVLKRNEYLGCSKKGYSEVSQKLFDSIIENYNNDEIFYATRNKEYKISKSDNKGYWLYDFVDIKNKKIIEFQGDKFHANPKLYESSDKPHPFYKDMTSSDIWENDNRKKIDAEKENFKVFYVWESDFKNDNNLTILKCLEFLRND